MLLSGWIIFWTRSSRSRVCYIKMFPSPFLRLCTATATAVVVVEQQRGRRRAAGKHKYFMASRILSLFPSLSLTSRRWISRKFCGPKCFRRRERTREWNNRYTRTYASRNSSVRVFYEWPFRGTAAEMQRAERGVAASINSKKFLGSSQRRRRPKSRCSTQYRRLSKVLLP